MYSTYSVFSVLNTFQTSIILKSIDGKQNTPQIGARGVRIVALSSGTLNTRMRPHTKFEISPSNGIGDMLRT